MSLSSLSNNAANSSIQNDQALPLDPSVHLAEGCARFVELEAATWELTFENLGLPFNSEEFRRVATDSIRHVIEAALFYGGNLTIEDLPKIRLGAVHSVAIIQKRLELLRKYGTFEERQRFRLVD